MMGWLGEQLQPFAMYSWGQDWLCKVNIWMDECLGVDWTPHSIILQQGYWNREPWTCLKYGRGAKPPSETLFRKSSVGKYVLLGNSRNTPLPSSLHMVMLVCALLAAWVKIILRQNSDSGLTDCHQLSEEGVFCHHWMNNIWQVCIIILE